MRIENQTRVLLDLQAATVVRRKIQLQDVTAVSTVLCSACEDITSDECRHSSKLIGVAVVTLEKNATRHF